LVGLVVTQNGQKVAKSLSTIIASFIVIGGTALALLACRPYHKRNENLLESFIDLCSTFNISIALCLHEGWLAASSSGVSWVVYLILVPNLLVLAVAIYIMNPRALWCALRFKYRQFQDRSREHRDREKEFADRESRALFDAAFKGDVQRVKDLLAQGKADVRYEKPKDVKPVGFAGYSPTQIAVAALDREVHVIPSGDGARRDPGIAARSPHAVCSGGNRPEQQNLFAVRVAVSVGGGAVVDRGGLSGHAFQIMGRL